jgi:hypothetical protein
MKQPLGLSNTRLQSGWNFGAAVVETAADLSLEGKQEKLARLPRQFTPRVGVS